MKCLRQLRPLFDGADRIVSNGDALDTQNADIDKSGVMEVKTFFADLAPTTFITGNHDPDISQTHELSLAHGAVWLTHGDVFFDTLMPWSHCIPEIKKRLRNAWAKVPRIKHDHLETRLRVFREVCLGLPRDMDPRAAGPRATLRLLTLLAFPPRYPLSLLHTWTTMSKHAARLATRHRPDARFVIFGHTHLPGVWQKPGGRVIINTGSFCAPLPCQIVELHATQLRIRPVVLRRGEFRLEPPIKTFALPAPVLSSPATTS